MTLRKMQLRTMRREKVLVTSIVCFPKFFQPYHRLSHLLCGLNCPNFNNLTLGKELTLLPDNKIYALSKLKAFTDQSICYLNFKFVFHRVENIVGKEKMLATSIFFFPTIFSKGFFLVGIKICHCVVKGKG